MKDFGTLLDTTPLDNGLKLHFYDQSRPVAGDRWLVQLLIDLPISVDDSILQGLPASDPPFGDFLDRFGPTIHYQVTKTRHFVPQEDTKAILADLRNEFLAAGIGYLNHPEFPRRYVLKVYKEWAEKEKFRRAHLKAIQEADTKR